MSDSDLLDMIDPDDEQLGMRKLTHTAQTRRMAWILSLLGFLPFILLALILVVISNDNPQNPIVVDAMKTYGAVILSFLGGSRWSMTLRYESEESARNTLIMAVMPALLGWFALMLPTPYVFAVLAIAFAGQGAWDTYAGFNNAYLAWFMKLRTVLTLLVTTAMIIAFFGTI